MPRGCGGGGTHDGALPPGGGGSGTQDGGLPRGGGGAHDDALSRGGTHDEVEPEVLEVGSGGQLLLLYVLLELIRFRARRGGRLGRPMLTLAASSSPFSFPFPFPRHRRRLSSSSASPARRSERSVRSRFGLMRLRVMAAASVDEDSFGVDAPRPARGVPRRDTMLADNPESSLSRRRVEEPSAPTRTAAGGEAPRCSPRPRSCTADDGSRERERLLLLLPPPRSIDESSPRRGHLMSESGFPPSTVPRRGVTALDERREARRSRRRSGL